VHIEEVAERTYRFETPLPGIGLILSVYLINGEEGILVEPGPAAAVPAIQEAMKQIGMSELSWIIPTHLHMDHAGGTGKLAELFPNAQVILHPLSAKHSIDPSRLIQSTRITYGEDFEDRYGPIVPVPEEQVKIPDDGEVITLKDRELQIIYSPGHAPYHISIFDRRTGGLFCGEALGMPTSNPLPAAATPSFDLRACLQTMGKLQSLNPEILFYSHGGVGREPEKLISKAMETTSQMGEVVLQSTKNGDSQDMISQKVIDYGKPVFPPEWEEEMIFVWKTGIIEGYTLYFKKEGLI